jgi:CheY-like chemotaxis protein
LATFKNVLLIDDDEDDQEIFLAALKQKSVSVSFRGEMNALDALEKLTSGQLVPDVIFLDLNMPLMSGRQFLKEIKSLEDLKNIPVIIFSTSSQGSTINETRALGASGFITKPDTLDDLIDILSGYFQ